MSAKEEFLKIKTYEEYEKKRSHLDKELDPTDEEILKHMDELAQVDSPPDGLYPNMNFNGTEV